MSLFQINRLHRPLSSSTKHTLFQERLRVAGLLALLLVTFAVSPWANADVRVTEVRSSQIIQIYGTIGPTDPAALEKLLPATRSLSVSLNSVGGDVAAAMALGRILRREDKGAVIGPNDVCISACVLVLAGATHRAIFEGKVGIHRPFVGQDSATTVQQQKAQYAEIERTVRGYLREMNIDARLYDDMFRISPANVKYLAASEIRAYGLEGFDPYVEQAYFALRAKDLGISTQELLRRRHEAEAKCKRPRTNFGKCYLAIEIGISDREYARREGIAQNKCAREASKIEQARCHDRIIHGVDKAE